VNEGIVYADNYKIKPNGSNWEWESLKVDNHRAVTVIAVSPTTGAIYAKDKDDGNSLETTKIWRSTDQGIQWQETTIDAIPVKPNQVSQIAISPANDYNIYAATNSGGIYVLSEQDGRWEQKNQGVARDIPDTPGNQYNTKYIAIDPVNPNIIYIGKNAEHFGHSDGILVSTDSGESWENISKNLGMESTIWGIKVNPNNDAVYIATSLGTWALSPLLLNYHFDETNDDFTVHNDSIHSITTDDAELGDGRRGDGTSIAEGWHRGTSLQFDGSSDAYVEVPTYTTGLKNIDRFFSIEAMIKIDSDESLENGPIVTDRNRLRDPGGFLLRSWYRRLAFNIISASDPNISTVVRSERKLEKNTWCHVVATFNRGVARLYINGIEEDNNKENVTFESTDLQSSRPLYLGVSQLNAANLHGAIDEVKLYNRVLTSREIKNHYDWISQ
jgi:photosystem II stability/assembly factor-like uncharacterized protein